MAAMAAGLRAPAAFARARGLAADSCDGCHGGGTEKVNVTMAVDRMPFNPGDEVTMTLTIASPSIRVGGTAVTADGVGTFRVLSGEGLAASGPYLIHTNPKAATGGAVTFEFAWRAPSVRGGVSFRVAALAGNGNNASSGDSPGYGVFQWVFGCSGKTFFADIDADGYGSSLYGTRMGCDDAPPPDGYAPLDGDCDENDKTVNPDGVEVCNRKDDDCDGQVDENAPAVTLWPDPDGDGYYRLQTGTPMMGCGNVPGYASQFGDCAEGDPTIHPGAEEVCNLKDDNCDGRVDERVRPICGVGWCARYSTTCDIQDCVPGQPEVETCNSLDDDCDGEVDEDTCTPGFFCVAGQCVPDGTGTVDAGTGTPDAAPDAASGGTGGTPGGSGSGGAGPSGGSGGSAPGGGATGGKNSGCSVAGPADFADPIVVGLLFACAILRRRQRQRQGEARPPTRF